jgi:hypothetical protein
MNGAKRPPATSVGVSDTPVADTPDVRERPLTDRERAFASRYPLGDDREKTVVIEGIYDFTAHGPGVATRSEPSGRSPRFHSISGTAVELPSDRWVDELAKGESVRAACVRLARTPADRVRQHGDLLVLALGRRSVEFEVGWGLLKLRRPRALWIASGLIASCFAVPWLVERIRAASDGTPAVLGMIGLGGIWMLARQLFIVLRSRRVLDRIDRAYEERTAPP